MKIGHQIAARRKQLKLSTTTLAGRIGLSHQAIDKWEQLRSFPRQANLVRAEQALSFQFDANERATPAELGLSETATETVAAGVGCMPTGQTVPANQCATAFSMDDLELLLVLAQLPKKFKDQLAACATSFLEELRPSERGGSVGR